MVGKSNGEILQSILFKRLNYNDPSLYGDREVYKTPNNKVLLGICFSKPLTIFLVLKNQIWIVFSNSTR